MSLFQFEAKMQDYQVSFLQYTAIHKQVFAQMILRDNPTHFDRTQSM